MNPSNISSVPSIQPAGQSLRYAPEQIAGPSSQNAPIKKVSQSPLTFTSLKALKKEIKHISLSDISDIKIGEFTYKKIEGRDGVAFHTDTNSKKDRNGDRIDNIKKTLKGILVKETVLKSNVELISKRLMHAARKVDSPMSLFSGKVNEKRCKSALANMGQQGLVNGVLTDHDIATIARMAIAKLTPVKADNFARIEMEPQKAMSELINESKELTTADKIQLRAYIDALSYCHQQEVKKKGTERLDKMGECDLIASALFNRKASVDESTGNKDLPALFRTLMSEWSKAKASGTTDVTVKHAVGTDGQRKLIAGYTVDNLCETIKSIARDGKRNEGLFRTGGNLKEMEILENISKEFAITLEQESPELIATLFKREMRETIPFTEIDYSEMAKLIETHGTEKKVNDVDELNDIVDVAISYCFSSDPVKESEYRQQLETFSYCYKSAPDGDKNKFTKISVADSSLPVLFEKVLTTLDIEKANNIRALVHHILGSWPDKKASSTPSS